jgi:hypothetical protein
MHKKPIKLHPMKAKIEVRIFPGQANIAASMSTIIGRKTTSADII